MRWGPARVRLLPRTVRLRLTAIYVALFLLSGAGLLAITYLLVASHHGKPVLIGSGATGGAPSGVIPRACPAPAVGLPSPQQLGACATYLRTQGAAVQRTADLTTLLVGSGVALAAMTLAAVGLGWVMAGRVLRPLRTITATAKNISASNLHERLALTGPDDELKELGDTMDGLLSRLEASFQAQRQFVANASHELRTPLARQRTLMEVALADPAPTVASLQAVCERVLAAGQQQERLIEALLTLARSQRGLDRWELVDLAAVATDVVRARQAEAADQQVRVHLETAGQAGPALVWGDGRLVERLVANLVDNAIRYNVPRGAPGGWVTVQVGSFAVDTAPAVGGSGGGGMGARAWLRVANSGQLIPPGEVARLFAPFQRLEAGRAGAGHPAGRDGQGLGLSIVSAIAAAHGADLEGRALPDGGLNVQLRFPPVPAEAEQSRSAVRGGFALARSAEA